MVILGINAYHADASACLVVDGQLVAATEEDLYRSNAVFVEDHVVGF